MSTQSYDYTADKKDDVDKIGFGKHKNWTPAELYMHEPKYIVWAWRKTNFWVGSEELVKRAHVVACEKFHPREEPTDMSKSDNANEEEVVEAFEAACIETFGCFPYKHWNT